jgi:hypothetical protein
MRNFLAEGIMLTGKSSDSQWEAIPLVLLGSAGIVESLHENSEVRQAVSADSDC